MSEQAAAPAASAPGNETYFNASRLKVISLILAGVLAVGALGGIAGVAFDPAPPENFGPVETPVSAPGAGSGQHKAVAVPGAGAAGFLASAAPKGKGKFLQLSTGVAFWLPTGWRVDGASETSAFITNGKGSYAYVVTGVVNPRTPAASLISKNRKTLLPPGSYTQLQVSGPKKWAGAFGSVVSSSFMEYLAMWVDNQGSAPIYGQVYAGVRNDGMALILLVEHIPPDGWAKVAPTMGNIIGNSFGQFGGVL